jgi:hypothetical protein
LSRGERGALKAKDSRFQKRDLKIASPMVILRFCLWEDDCA